MGMMSVTYEDRCGPGRDLTISVSPNKMFVTLEINDGERIRLSLGAWSCACSAVLAMLAPDPEPEPDEAFEDAQGSA